MISQVRAHLIDIFDLNPKQSAVSALFDRLIYVVIIVSTIGVVLETLPSMQGYLALLEEIESIILAFFLVELALQLMVIKALFDRHPSVQERATILFYLLIDILAILPPFILYLELHHHFDYFLSLRLIRIFKVFRHDHSVEFIIRAVLKKKTELLKSVALTSIFTIFLAVVLFEVENNLDKGHTSRFTDILTTLWWSLDIYMDEVSGYVKDDFRPVTAVGMFIAGLMGFMKIAIVIIPTGIVASGFIEVIEEDKIREKYALLLKAYRKKYHPKLGVALFEQPHSLITVKNALNFSDQDVYKILESRDGFRMRSIMSSSSEKYSDINIIEHFAYGTLTTYGTRNVEAHHEFLLVCPNNFEERGMSYFAYCLSVVINGGMIANEKYRVNSLNPDFDYDFVNSPMYESVKAGQYSREDVKHCIRPEKAFYSFVSDISAHVGEKMVILMKADSAINDFVIESDSASAGIDRWLKRICGQTFVLRVNPELLDEDREYKIVLNVKEAIAEVHSRLILASVRA